MRISERSLSNSYLYLTGPSMTFGGCDVTHWAYIDKPKEDD